MNKKMNRVKTTTPSSRSEKEGLAREPRELSCEELESIIGGVAVEATGFGGRFTIDISEGIEGL